MLLTIAKAIVMYIWGLKGFVAKKSNIYSQSRLLITSVRLATKIGFIIALIG